MQNNNIKYKLCDQWENKLDLVPKSSGMSLVTPKII